MKFLNRLNYAVLGIVIANALAWVFLVKMWIWVSRVVEKVIQ